MDSMAIPMRKLRHSLYGRNESIKAIFIPDLKKAISQGKDSSARTYIVRKLLCV